MASSVFPKLLSIKINFVFDPKSLLLIIPFSISIIGWFYIIDFTGGQKISYQGIVVSKHKSDTTSAGDIILNIDGKEESFSVSEKILVSAALGKIIEINYAKGRLGFEKMKR